MEKALTRQEIINTIEGKGRASRIPMMYHFWIFPHVFGEREDQVKEILERYPSDVNTVALRFPHIKYENDAKDLYSWNQLPMSEALKEQGYDNRLVLEDWKDLEDFLKEFPSADDKRLIPKVESTEQYRLVYWWGCFFERLWEFRGMENALTDFYLYPDEVHCMLQKLTDFYMRAMERAKNELNADGIFTSDDLGTQTGPFFSVEFFREFFKPYYKQLFDKAHELGLHFWLHSCGNIEPLIPEFIEIGLDVLHPIQKYTMDEAKIAKQYGKEICIWYGFDVQQTIPYGTAEEVRTEIQRVVDIFDSSEGRFMMTTGNASTSDWKLESIEALFEETLQYGSNKAKETRRYSQVT